MPAGPSIAEKIETLENAGGLKIVFRSWQPAAPATGVMVIVPGFNSHSGYYGWVAEQLVSLGLAVYAVDLRGRGKSDGERFYVESVRRLRERRRARGGDWRSRAIPACPCTCSVTARAASSRASTRSSIRRNSPASSARASRSRCRPRTSRSPCSRAWRTSRRTRMCCISRTRTSHAIRPSCRR